MDCDHSSVSSLPATRGYQQELLNESLKRNIIIALDTGSGKTHIAVLRIKAEVQEREPKKLSWFIAPTVALVEQQKDVISTYIPVSVGMVSGASEPDQWKDRSVWRRILDTRRIMVTTPQVLLDALRHGYINLGRDISLLVFDEVHHAGKNHPYNVIMKEFYFRLPARGSAMATPDSVRPMILGLTASPIFGGQVEQAFKVIEQNLDATICSTRFNLEELAQFVHRPRFENVSYALPDYLYQSGEDGRFAFTSLLPSHNFTSLQTVVNQLNIEDDPYIKSLRRTLARLPSGTQRNKSNQKLSGILKKGDTLTHRSLKDFLSSAAAICIDVGPWATDWYIQKVVEQAKKSKPRYKLAVRNLEPPEKQYLVEILTKVNIVPVSYEPDVVRMGVTDRINKLIQVVSNEMQDFESHAEIFSGIVFVTRRDVCIAVAEVLRHHPATRDTLQVGCLLGTSADTRRMGFLDVTRNLVVQPHAEILGDFRIGAKNLIVSTSVAEEGIDVQACCTVVRWDPPQNMISWAQSRGRARRKRSSFIIMTANDERPSVLKWEELEREMMALYNNPARVPQSWSDEEYSYLGTTHYELRIPETGAVLTLHSAIAHLNHFCAVLPNAGYGNCLPIYETDPPEFFEEWQSMSLHDPSPASGLFGATVYLPRHLPQALRVFRTERVHRSKVYAKMYVAFLAYKALYEFTEEQYLDKHLLPLSSIAEDEQALFDSGVDKKSSTSLVTAQMDPWAPQTHAQVWWVFEIRLDELPELFMLTERELFDLKVDELPVLYLPGRNAPMKVSLHPMGKADSLGLSIDDARIFTRKLFWWVPGSKSKAKWDNLNFKYLFYSRSKPTDPIWDARWLWASSGGVAAPDDSRANAEAFGMTFNYPTDITYVRSLGVRKREDFQFLKWRFDQLTIDEEQQLRDRYVQRGHRQLEIIYPLITVRPLGRKDFLVPFPVEKRYDSSRKDEEFLVPRHSTIHVASPHVSSCARLLPSILRHLAVAYTVTSFRETLLSSTPLAVLPFETLATALSAPCALRQTNYERLESLGDAVLKLMASVQIMADHPFWHEGYLSLRKDHVVANATLGKCAISKELYRWIIRDSFVPTRWSPQVWKAGVETSTENGVTSMVEKESLSTKLLADVVEALIGAAYIHGDFEMAIECAKLFGMGIHWNPLPVSMGTILGKMEILEGLPVQMVNYVESMLDYEFTNKILVVEALTHPSYNMHIRARPYDRLEFLGDAVLDMIVVDYLYRAPGKRYNPGHLYQHKVAIVNLHFLAYICLERSLTLDTFMPVDGDVLTETAEEDKIYLWQCLLHSNAAIMEDMDLTFTRFKKAAPRIATQLEEGSIYPWAALTSLQAPKFFSDMIESLLGAIFLDTNGNLDIVQKTLRVLGIMPVLERIVRCNVDVLHPVSRLSYWAGKSKPQKEIKYKFHTEHGKIYCRILMKDKDEKTKEKRTEERVRDEEAEEMLMRELVRTETVYSGQASREEVKFAAAEKAIRILRLREEEEDMEVI